MRSESKEAWRDKLKSRHFICEGDGTHVEIWGFRDSLLKKTLVYLAYVFTVFILRLIFHWFPQWRLSCSHKSCSLIEAHKILVKDSCGVYHVHKVMVCTIDGTRANFINSPCFRVSGMQSEYQIIQVKSDANLLCYFVHKRIKYLWNQNSEQFELLRGWEDGPYSQLYSASPLSEEVVRRRRCLYGVNEISIQITPFFKLLVNEGLNPFYIFQLASCTLWFIDEYYIYSVCIILMSCISLAWQLYEIRKNERALKDTVCGSSTVSVCREVDGSPVYEEINSVDLVPGDIINIPCNGCVMHCDAALLVGNCIVNESTLTGESVPVIKTPLPTNCDPDKIFDLKEMARHVLFGGTAVIQTRNYANERVLAVVVRTGFHTSKGEMVRSILFPKPMKFKFTQDAMKFVGALAITASCGFAFSLYIMIKNQENIGTVFIRAFDLITIVVPPALPVAMTVGIVFAQRRLRRHNIYCINPSVINVCGVINVACFDKTGTLTEDGLDLWGVIPAGDGRFFDPEDDPSKLEHGPLLEALASCHSLTRIENKLSGDPLDLKMFQSTKWEFIEEMAEDYCKFEMAVPAIVRPVGSSSLTNINLETAVQMEQLPYEVGILRQFPFSSSLQRMSVVARVLNSTHFNVYTKGAPEIIESLCRRDTLPRDFHTVLLEYTREGYRVLALAWRPLKLSYTRVLRINRERVERELRFLGLLIMENRLKPETAPVIHTLLQANIRPVMVTGDNMLTALSVARDCEMIDELDRVIIVSAKPPPEFPSVDGQHFAVASGGDVGGPEEMATQLSWENHRSSAPSPAFSVPHARTASTTIGLHQDQYAHLVQFHYAEDLHRPVTEVTTATSTRNWLNRSRQQRHHHSVSKRRNPTTDCSVWLRRHRFMAHTSGVDNYSIEHTNSQLYLPISSVQPSADSSVEVEQHSVTFAPSFSRDTTNHHASHPVTIRMLDRPDFHLALSGKTWAVIKKHYPWLIPKLVVKGTVFARFSPDQKAQVVEALQSVGYYVSMCGDGANDCGALKAAHAGVSLSEAEASVASPFTSKRQDISCIPLLIKEGRCALATSFGTFKFMTGYSLTQFTTVILLYIVGSSLGDMQFLYIDFLLITTLGISFGYTQAYPHLSIDPPSMRLLCTVTMMSLGLQLIVNIIIQAGAFFFIRLQPWYLPLSFLHDEFELKNYENTALFIVSAYQYVILAVVFSKGAPYRRSMFSNYLFMANVFLGFVLTVCVTTLPITWIHRFLQLMHIPSHRAKLILLSCVLANFLAGYTLELLVDGVSFRRRIRRIRRALFPRQVHRKDYERIRDELDRMAGTWPPIIRSASVQDIRAELFAEGEASPGTASHPHTHTMRRRHTSGTSSGIEDDSAEQSCSSPAPPNGPVNEQLTVFYPTVPHETFTEQYDQSQTVQSVEVAAKSRKRKRTLSASMRRRHSLDPTDVSEPEFVRFVLPSEVVQDETQHWHHLRYQLLHEKSITAPYASAHTPIFFHLPTGLVNDLPINSSVTNESNRVKSTHVPRLRSRSSGAAQNRAHDVFFPTSSDADPR